jgi:hypothetical protein
MVMKFNKISYLVSAFVILCFGCESKMEEKRAADYTNKQAVDERLKVQSDLDEKMNRLQTLIQNVQNLINKVNEIFQIQKLPSQSILEIISQIASQVQSKIPRMNDTQLSITGTFTLGTSLLEKECQNLGYKLFSESLMPLKTLNYSMKSCFTNDQLIDVLKVNFTETEIKLDFNKDSLKILLPSEALNLQISECKFSDNKSEPTVCKNVPFAQGEKLVWVADITSFEKTQIDIRGTSKKTGSLVYIGQAIFLQNGKIENLFLYGPFAEED